MIMDFDLASSIEGDVLVLKTEGYINNDGGQRIVEEFSKHFADGISKVLIDIEGSKVVNSIGISYLIEIIEKLNERSGTLYFCNMDAAIEKTFTIMGLFQFAKKVNSVSDIN